MWKTLLTKTGNALQSASEFLHSCAGSQRLEGQVHNESELHKLKRQLDEIEASKEDSQSKEGDFDKKGTGISFGLTEPVHYLAYSPREIKVMTMHALKDSLVNATLANVELRRKGDWKLDDDAIFGPHTGLVCECIKHNTPKIAIDAWQETIRAVMESCDNDLSKLVPAKRVHKGAILHNIALCHLIAGDLDSAFQLYSAAGEEDQILGRGDWTNVVLGKHELTEKRLLDSIIKTADELGWSATYKDSLGISFDKEELSRLLKWLTSIGKDQDAIQLLHALHRLNKTRSNFRSKYGPHIQVRAIADIILVVESSLRGWQQVGVTGQLHARLESALPQSSLVRQSFDSAHLAYCGQFSSGHPDRETEVGINWAIADCIARYANETSTAKKAGIVANLSAKLRNSLMHVILAPVSLYSNEQERLEVAGMALTMVGLSKCAHQGPFPIT